MWWQGQQVHNEPLLRVCNWLYWSKYIQSWFTKRKIIILSFFFPLLVSWSWHDSLAVIIIALLNQLTIHLVVEFSMWWLLKEAFSWPYLIKIRKPKEKEMFAVRCFDCLPPLARNNKTQVKLCDITTNALYSQDKFYKSDL